MGEKTPGSMDDEEGGDGESGKRVTNRLFFIPSWLISFLLTSSLTWRFSR